MEIQHNALGRYGKLVLILLGIAVVVWLAAISMAVLIPFLVGVLLAYLLMPVVKWLEKTPPAQEEEQEVEAWGGRGDRVRCLQHRALALFVAYLGVRPLYSPRAYW